MTKIQEESSSISITNSEFLSAIFKNLGSNEYLWTTAFSVSPELAKGSDWVGARAYSDTVPDTHFANSYFCVSSLVPAPDDSRRRKIINFSALHAVVLDDVEDVDAPPTWRLETSAGKYQVGYVLDEPINDVSIAQRLHAALATQNRIKLDMSGNNAVRLTRLPVGLNTKYVPHFACRLDVWSPHLTVTLVELCANMGIDHDSVVNGLRSVSPEGAQYQSDGLREDDDYFISKILEGESYHEPLNILAARYAASGVTESQTNDVLKSLMNFSQGAHDERWAHRRDDISRSVRGAFEKFYNPNAQTDTLAGAQAAYSLLAGTSDTLSAIHPLANFIDYSLTAQKPREYILDGIIGTGLLLISGAAGSGKTTNLIPLFTRVAHLCPSDDPIKPLLRRKIIWVTEDSLQAQAVLRSMYISGDLGTCTESEVKEYFKLVDARRMPAHEIVKVAQTYLAMTTPNMSPATGETVDALPYLVLDTTNASIDIENESDNSQVGRVLAAFKQAFKGLSMTAIAHLAKVMKRADLADLSARGAGAWEADANQVAYLILDEDGSRWLEIKNAKHRFMAQIDEIGRAHV